MAFTSSKLSRTAIVTLVAGSGAAAIWAGVLAKEWPRLMLAGTLCSEAESSLGHCWACYPAAALTLLAIGGGIAWLAQAANAIQRPPAPTVTQMSKLA
jgi:hypothetical protein